MEAKTEINKTGCIVKREFTLIEPMVFFTQMQEKKGGDISTLFLIIHTGWYGLTPIEWKF